MTPHRLPGAEPPLDPSPDEARSQLRRELLRPEYHEDDLLRRVLTWLARQVDRGLQAAAEAPPLSTAAAMLIGLALVGAVGWLASRARRAGSPPRRPGAVLTDESLDAGALRARAETALAEDRPADALLDAYRALAQRQVELGRLDDRPGATAHEVADSLAAGFPDQRDRVVAGAELFDAVLYGDRPASPEQARDLLALDDDMAARR